jgi:GR25 family glycosyltransferase involved in LPS biosynthesis
MHAYVINLADRTDRWNSVLAQTNRLGLPIKRIDAVGLDQISDNDLFVAKGVAATWRSHQLAMSSFLDSGEPFGIILEDDFLISEQWSVEVARRALNVNPDFFQLGFLVTSPQDRLDLMVNNLIDLFLKFFCWLSNSFPQVSKKYGHRLLVREQAGLSLNIVANDIRAGGQAYLVSRKFALASKFMNTPPFTSADGMFISLGDLRSFRMFRFRSSLINQTQSKTSVQQRYL